MLSRFSILLTVALAFQPVVSSADTVGCEDWNSYDFTSQALPDDIQRCLDTGADIAALNEREFTPLISAIYFNRPDLARALLEAGADPNQVGQGQGTALHYAAEEGDVDTVKILIETGADLNVRNVAEETPLHLAAGSEENQEAVFVLLRNGANADARDEHGRSALHNALLPRNSETREVIEALVTAGADMNIQPSHGRPILHSAVKFYNFEGLETLLDLGANAGLIDFQGKTALDHMNAQTPLNSTDMSVRAQHAELHNRLRTAE